MSDFLTDLIQRQEKLTDAVRPRLPSMFETGGGTERLRNSGDPLSEPIVEETSPVAEAPRATRPLPQAARQEPAAPAQEIGDIQPAFTAARERAAPVLPEPLRPLEQNLEREPPAATMQPRRASKIEAKPAEAFQASEEPVRAIRPVVEQRPARLSPVIEEMQIAEAPRIAAARHAAESFTPQTSAAALRPVPQLPVSEHPAATASPFAMLPPQTRRETRETRREQHEQPHTGDEPSIHVTIGRIEIRASEDREPRTRKHDAPSPVMTLDDYLKSRAKR
jgi:hypothetical protein